MVKQRKVSGVVQSGVGVDGLAEMAFAIAPAEVSTLGISPTAAKRAACQGISMLERVEPRVRERWPQYDFVAVKRLPEVLDRVRVAQHAVRQARTGRLGARERIRAAIAWRSKLLPVAQAMARVGTLPAATVKRIGSQVGTTDSLQAVVDLCEVLTPQRAAVEAMLGKGALTAAQAEARQALSQLGRSGSNRSEVRRAIELRDRYATLAHRLHERLRVGIAVASSWGEAERGAPSLKRGRAGTRAMRTTND